MVVRTLWNRFFTLSDLAHWTLRGRLPVTSPYNVLKSCFNVERLGLTHRPSR
jgi:hypothetical protein